MLSEYIAPSVTTTEGYIPTETTEDNTEDGAHRTAGNTVRISSAPLVLEYLPTETTEASIDYGPYRTLSSVRFSNVASMHEYLAAESSENSTDQSTYQSVRKSASTGSVDPTALSRARAETRRRMNLFELNLDHMLALYDADGSGFLEVDEVETLLSFMRRRKATREELQWIMSIADIDQDGRLSKDELIDAVRAWEGFISMPQHAKELFDRFDSDRSGYLELAEFQALLEEISGEEVHELEAREVMAVAAMSADGSVARHELLGAIGAWYVQIGREPTPALSLAFAANHQTSSKCAEIVNILIAASLAPCAFVAVGVGLEGEKQCSHALTWSLMLEGVLWGMLTIVFILKSRWVQVLTTCYTFERATQLVWSMSWLLVVSELAVCSLLSLVELFGSQWALPDARADRLERDRCDKSSRITSLVASVKAREVRYYPSYLDFCHEWLLINLVWNATCLIFYYGHVAHRFIKLRRADRSMQAFETSLNDQRSTVRRLTDRRRSTPRRSTAPAILKYI